MGAHMTEQAEFVLRVVYQPINILHVLDLIKFTEKTSELIHHTFEYCGFKDTVRDLTVFCALDGFDETHVWKKCSPQQILTNFWWRVAVLLSQSTRILYNIGQIIGYAIDIKTTGQVMAAAHTASTLYDMGDDFGTMARYILDFHQVERIDIGDWD